MRLKPKFIFILTLFFLMFYSSISLATGMLIDDASNINVYSSDFEISSSAGILVDADYGKVLYEKCSKDTLFPASTTKVMTAILTCEKCNLKDKVTVSYWAVHSVPKTYITGNVLPGEVYSVEQLLNITMIASANDAAFALAEYIANLDNPNYLKDSSEDARKSFSESISKFADMMNEKAKEFGCLNTHFVNPNGIHDDNHYSTAYDLALIGIHAYTNPAILNIASKKNYELSANDKKIEIKSTNPLLREDSEYYYPYANGLKTGFTNAAGSCIIATAKKDNMNLLLVILNGQNLEDGTHTRDQDCINLFNYGFEHFATTKLITTQDVVKTVDVLNATKSTKELNLVPIKDLEYLLVKGKVLDITPEIQINSSISAPIAKGQVLRKYNIYY